MGTVAEEVVRRANAVRVKPDPATGDLCWEFDLTPSDAAKLRVGDVVPGLSEPGDRWGVKGVWVAASGLVTEVRVWQGGGFARVRGDYPEFRPAAAGGPTS